MLHNRHFYTVETWTPEVAEEWEKEVFFLFLITTRPSKAVIQTKQHRKGMIAGKKTFIYEKRKKK